ncbi:hypothetical protein SMICM304S_11611 [Streptomyces microflavus]
MNTGNATTAEAACTDALPGAALSGPVSHAVSRIARLHRIAAGKLLKGLGLYPGQELLMMHLWDAGPVRQSELIRTLDLDPSTVTKMLQRLEQTGHVRRRPDPATGRPCWSRRRTGAASCTRRCGTRGAAWRSTRWPGWRAMSVRS